MRRELSVFLLLAAPVFAQSTLSPPVKIAIPDVVPFHKELHPQYLWGKGKGFKVRAAKSGELRFLVDKGQYLGWTTQRIRVGDDDIVNSQGEFSMSHDESNVRYDRGSGVVERYELSAKGLEQSWILDKRPNGEGDLVVEGAIGGGLIPRRDFNTGGHEFVNKDGVAFVRYGTAMAIDAKGTKTELQVNAEDGAASIVVPYQTWSSAAFPLTIDPLWLPTAIAGSGDITPFVAFDSRANKLCIAGFNDEGVFAWISDPDFSNQQLIFSLIGADRQNCSGVACVESQSKFCVLTTELHGTVQTSSVHLPDSRRPAFGAGRGVALPQHYGILELRQTLPMAAIAGSTGNGTMALVTGHDWAVTGASSFVLLDVATFSVVRTGPLPPPSGYALSQPFFWLTAAASAADPWVISVGLGSLVRVWPSGRTDVREYGRAFAAVAFGGHRGTYRLMRWDPSGDEILNRVDWPNTATSPTFHGPIFSSRNRIRRHLAFDSTTLSHCITVRGGYIERFGYDGLVEVVPFPDTRAKTLFDRRNRRFVLVSASSGQVRGWHLNHDRRTSNEHLGTACGLAISANHPPYAGSAHYQVNGLTLRSNTHFLYISKLWGRGTIGSCPIYVELRSPWLVATVPVRPDARGRLVHPLPLPSDPALHGPLYMQFVNFLHRESSNLLKANIWP